MEDKEQEAKQCELELERRIYYLKTLYDLSLEIGYQRETHEIIKNLLLMMIGTFGASRGLILLLDKTRRKIDALTQRGLTPDSINLLVDNVQDIVHRIYGHDIVQFETLKLSDLGMP